VIEILKLLPRTNCRECGETTCMVFAARMAEGVKDPGDCLTLGAENKKNLEAYMGQFRFEF